MSIEAKIDALFGALEANTAATKELTAAWAALTSQANGIQADIAEGKTKAIAAGGTVVAEVKAPKAEKAAKAEKPAATPPAAAPAPAAPVETDSVSASRSEVEHDGTPYSVTLADVQAALKAKLADHKAELKAVLASFGATSASTLDPTKWQAALDAINAIGSAEEDLA